MISGSINLIISLIIIVITNIAIPSYYQILINVISINLQNNLLIYSISSIIIGLFLKLVSKIFHKEEIINNWKITYIYDIIKIESRSDKNVLY